MSKKIVILNGSPRITGNTSMLVDAFTEGAISAGHQVTAFHLESMNIHGCKGCLGGHGKADFPCTQRDDMDLIYPAVKEADVIVFASPLYYWTFSGQLRIATDRLFALEEGDGHLLGGNGRSSALLMAAEGSGFDDVVAYYDRLMERIHWTNLGHVLANGNTFIGDIAKKPEQLEEARKLGGSIQ